MKNILNLKTKLVHDLESDLENEIPEWYKKNGNYSLLPKMLNCNDKYNPNETKLKKELPNITDNEIKLNIKSEKNSWIFYWAAEPQKNRVKINDPIKAYGNQKNYGLIKTNKVGETTLILNCPQPYKVDNITYPRHVHYVHLKKDNTWSDKIKKIIFIYYINKINLKEIKDLK